MTKGGVELTTTKLFKEGPLSRDVLLFFVPPATEGVAVLKKDTVRDAFRCGRCESTLIYDGRRVQPSSGA